MKSLQGSFLGIQREFPTAELDHNLANLRNFSYLKVNDDVCRNTVSNYADRDIFLMIVVPSHPDHQKMRHVLRSVYNRRVLNRTVKAVFFFGKPDWASQRTLDDEDSIHHDIVQGNFPDSYKSIAHNHLQGLKWAIGYCPNVEYIAKADDDVFVNLHKLILALNGKPVDDHLLFCNFIYKAHVFRNPSDKYYVSRDQFPGLQYPTYCNGWLILYGRYTASQIVEQSTTSTFLWMSDVFITGVVVRDLLHRNSTAVHSRKMNDDEYTYTDKPLREWLLNGKQISKYYAGTTNGDWKLMRELHQKTDLIAASN